MADDNMEVTVVDVERGESALAALKGYNMFNSAPKEGMEYVLVRVRVKYLGRADQTHRLSDSDFRTVGELGAIYDGAFAVLGKDLASELFGGGVTEGELAFQVGRGEQGLALIYDSGSDTKAYYCQLTS